MSSQRLVGLTLAIIMAGLFVGCAESRPEAASLTESISRAAEADPAISLTEQEAGCIAERLLAGSLSDETMIGLAADFSQPDVLTSEADEVEPAVAEAAQACLAFSE